MLPCMRRLVHHATPPPPHLVIVLSLFYLLVTGSTLAAVDAMVSLLPGAVGGECKKQRWMKDED